MKNNQVLRLYLVGFMGTGKTHWGTIWAEKYQLPYIDLDALIEEKEQLSPQQVFEKKGEDYFRKVEAECLRSTEVYIKCVVSCGGGAPCFHDNMDWMNQHGTTVLLQANAVAIFENIKNETGKRPLLKGKNQAELLFFIEQLSKERKPFYDQASVKLETKELTEQSLDIIISSKK